MKTETGFHERPGPRFVRRVLVLARFLFGCAGRTERRRDFRFGCTVFANPSLKSRIFRGLKSALKLDFFSAKVGDNSWRFYGRILLILCLGHLQILHSKAAIIEEDFSSNPSQRGWKVFGDPSLFVWNSTNKNLEATWNSQKPNSYYYRALPTILAKGDDFSLAFDLVLNEIRIGLDPKKSFTFQIAVGFLNLHDATQTNFVRGTGAQSPNLIEFDYFPDSGFGATISPVIVSSNSQFFPSFSFPLELTPGDRFSVAMSYSGSEHLLATAMTRNGQIFGPIKDVKLPSQFSDFRADAVAVCSYSDSGSNGSVLARGSLDNLSVRIPDPLISGLSIAKGNGGVSLEFETRIGWTYALERSEDFATWANVFSGRTGTNDRQNFFDSASPPIKAFYRMRAERP